MNEHADTMVNLLGKVADGRTTVDVFEYITRAALGTAFVPAEASVQGTGCGSPWSSGAARGLVAQTSSARRRWAFT